jgi:hypothetical protein
MAAVPVANGSGEAGGCVGWTVPDADADPLPGAAWAVATGVTGLPVPDVSSCFVASHRWCTKRQDVCVPRECVAAAAPGGAVTVVVAEWVAGTGPNYADFYELTVRRLPVCGVAFAFVWACFCLPSA